jgi:hypothetical protein
MLCIRLAAVAAVPVADVVLSGNTGTLPDGLHCLFGGRVQGQCPWWGGGATPPNVPHTPVNKNPLFFSQCRDLFASGHIITSGFIVKWNGGNKKALQSAGCNRFLCKTDRETQTRKVFHGNTR